MSVSHLSAKTELLARIDVASICSTLGVSVGGASRPDVQLFGYLTSMVNSQQGNAPSAWGYPFAARPNGLPFAEALEFAIDRMVLNGEIAEGKNGLRLADKFIPIFNATAAGEAYVDRVALVRNVCGLAVFRPLPGIGRALMYEPQLRHAASLDAVRLIDDEALTKNLMTMMLKIRDQLPEQYPPSSPAMLWLADWESQIAE